MHRWKDNIKLGLRETVCEGMYWIHLAQCQALVNTVMNAWVP
jgi:hypothetical protein